MPELWLERSTQVTIYALIPMVDSVLTQFDSLGPFMSIPLAVVGTDNFDFMLEDIPTLVGIEKPANCGLTYHSASDTYDKVDLVTLKKNSTMVAAVTLAFANNPEARLTRMTHQGVQEMIDKYELEFSMRMLNVWDDWAKRERGRQ